MINFYFFIDGRLCNCAFISSLPSARYSEWEELSILGENFPRPTEPTEVWVNVLENRCERLWSLHKKGIKKVANVFPLVNRNLDKNHNSLISLSFVHNAFIPINIIMFYSKQ